MEREMYTFSKYHFKLQSNSAHVKPCKTHRYMSILLEKTRGASPCKTSLQFLLFSLPSCAV